MFDIGFWELAVIGVIALLVVGPERLPALARNVGMWVGRIRRYVTHVKQDIERELHAEEVRELLEQRNGLSEIRDVARETASVLDDARQELDGASREVKGESAAVTETQTTTQLTAPSASSEPFDAASISSVSPSGDAPSSEDAAGSPPSMAEDEQQPGRQG